MTDCASQEASRLFLHAGQVFASADHYEVVTVLGSCVAVCLWDRALRVGGMNHYALPQWPGPGGSARFGEPAVEQLLRAMASLGSVATAMEAKVFGGSSSLGEAGGGLAEKNVALAERLLDEAGIPISGIDVGGTRGRKVVFDTCDGSVRLQLL